MTAWQCIGCGRIEGAQPCIGICQDRKTEFVYAVDHDEVLNRLDVAFRRADTLATLVRQIACTTPRDGEWERSYRTLQARARMPLGMPPGIRSARPWPRTDDPPAGINRLP